MGDIKKKLKPDDGVVHYEPPRKKSKIDTIKVHPPLIALIDVMFTLMLFFVLAARAKTAEGEIPGALPSTSGVSAPTDKTPAPPIRITLQPTGEYGQSAQFEIEGASPAGDEEALYQQLKARKNANPNVDVMVQIRPRSVVRWEYVVKAFNQAVRAEFKNIGFAPPE